MAPTTGLQDVADTRRGREVGAALHVAIIMDGNGRWAKQRGLPRVLGHRAGVNALKRTVEAPPTWASSVLTVFGFSTENWSRPPPEVSELMGLLKAYLETDLERLAREGVRVRIIGRRDGPGADVLDVIERAETPHQPQQPLPAAGGLQLRRPGRHRRRRPRFAEAVERGAGPRRRPGRGGVRATLSTAGAPAPDLIVRTSGEQRHLQLPAVGMRLRRTRVSRTCSGRTTGPNTWPPR